MINSVEWDFYIAREPLTQQLKNDGWQENAKLETITFLYMKNRKSQNLDERSVRAKAFLLIGPRTLGMWTQQFNKHGECLQQNSGGWVSMGAPLAQNSGFQCLKVLV